MKIIEPLFVPSRNKFNLSTSTIWDSMERDITILCRFKPDWNKIPEDYDAGVVVRNGQHAGIQVRHSGGIGYIHGLIWVTEEDDNVKPVVIYTSIGKIERSSYYDVMLYHNHKHKEVTLMFGEAEKSDSLTWEVPFSRRLKYKGELVDYSSAWLWVGCCNALTEDADAGWFQGDINRVGLFTKPLDASEFIDFFSNIEYDNDRWEHKDPITYINFKERTAYKFRDLSGRGNNLNIYKPEWGDLF